MVINIILLLIGLFILLKSSDVLVDSASSLAVKLKIPKTLIALTIVAFGTCSPEIAISFTSIISNNHSMAISNVLGSCIINILLVIGSACLFNNISIKNETIKKEMPILLIITAIFSCFLLNGIVLDSIPNLLTRFQGIILLLLFTIFIIYLVDIVRKHNKAAVNEKAKFSTTKSIIYLIISIIVITMASNIVVESATILAEKLHISQKIITMTIIVIGTSLPELLITTTATKKNEYDMAIGNIIGTNIFNICIVLGLPTTIFGNISLLGFNIFDVIVLLLTPTLLYVFAKNDRKITKQEGILMLTLFLAYYLNLFLI